ncbi:6-pyruvoyl tetrahydropterin synthase family protein [Jannaschia sp. R86511]|uniref:6-pyruvoyl trahydropterin synthase family protein n=1 Tax=Jannaschia sp. R86511 TaxID=3093853 RepID=UPI0036D2C274
MSSSPDAPTGPTSGTGHPDLEHAVVEHAVTVEDSMMVAHSLPGEVFGPAQALHGATYVVRATFCRDALDGDGIVVDIGAAAAQLGEVLSDLTYTNLDDHPELTGVVTTTEVLASFVARRLLGRAAAGLLRGRGDDLTALRVELGENPRAAAAVTVRLREPRPGATGWPWA